MRLSVLARALRAPGLPGYAFIALTLALWFNIGVHLAVAQQPTPPPSEMDLCRQQLAAAHDAADTRERKMFLAMAEQQAAAEARQATLIEWLRAAQASASVSTVMKPQ